MIVTYFSFLKQNDKSKKEEKKVGEVISKIIIINYLI